MNSNAYMILCFSKQFHLSNLISKVNWNKIKEMRKFTFNYNKYPCVAKKNLNL